MRLVDHEQHIDENLETAAEAFLKPIEIPPKRKDKLIQVLQCRRDEMLKSSMKYYSRLSENIYVFGSEEGELFQITEATNGLRLKIYKCNSPTPEWGHENKLVRSDNLSWLLPLDFIDRNKELTSI